jgi:chromosome segregation ATPase
MSESLLNLALTAFASGGIAAVSAYVATVWRLSGSVTALQEEVKSLKKDQDKSHDVVEGLDKELDALRSVMNEFKVSCSDNRSSLLHKKDFREFTEEQGRKWTEFYRLVGKLEGLMDRIKTAQKDK